MDPNKSDIAPDQEQIMAEENVNTPKKVVVGGEPVRETAETQEKEGLTSASKLTEQTSSPIVPSKFKSNRTSFSSLSSSIASEASYRKSLPLRPVPAARRTSAAKTEITIADAAAARAEAASLESKAGTAPTKSTASRPNPLRFNSIGSERPRTAMTASTRRLSFSSMSSLKRKIKYGKGKYCNTELMPQPSDDSEDPLNWPIWKKELNFWALMSMVALNGVMKTAFISVNSQLAIGYQVSYTAVASLTGVPLMLSAATGAGSLVVARIWGKRPAYLAALAPLFIGSVWSTRVNYSFGQCMAARVFQGVGWGPFDALVQGSIQDTYFEHEHMLRFVVYNVIVVGTTWGGPLLGGVVSAHALGSALQFVVISSILAVAILLVGLGAPETAYDRSFYMPSTPGTAWSFKQLPMRPRMNLSWESALNYLREMKPVSYRRTRVDKVLLLQVPRAMLAPTTLLVTLVGLLPFCALWSMAASLSLLFTPLPFVLSMQSIGALMTAPWLTTSAVVVGLGLWPLWQSRFRPISNTAAIGTGTLLSFVGLLTFGLYSESCMKSYAAQGGSLFTVGGTSTKLSFPAVSFALGLLAAGVYVLDATVRPMVRRSTQYTSSNVAIAQRNTLDMCAGAVVWRTWIAGAFVIGLPNAVFLFEMLKVVSVSLVVVQVMVAAVIAGIWWRYEVVIHRLDGRTMHCVDLDGLRRSRSFFDAD